MTRTSDSQLVLLVGPAGCGKTRHMTESFETAVRGSRDLLADNLLFLLPNAEHRSRIIDLVLRRGLKGFFHGRITTIDQALKNFLRLSAHDFTGDVTRQIILKSILTQAKFGYFTGLTQAGGLLELLGRFIVELKEYLISPDELTKKLATLGRQFPEFQSKYSDLAQVYELYEGELEKRGLVDGRDALKLLTRAIERGEASRPSLEKVWIDGFSDFSKLQLSFIEFLARHSREVTISLTLDEAGRRSSLFTIPLETQAALEDIGFRISKMGPDNHRAKIKTLVHLQHYLFDPTPKKTGADAHIRILEATGLFGEAEMIAREIKRLVRLEGYHFSDIAVICRQTDLYLNAIGRVFERFQVPLEVHERFRLRNNPLSRTLASFFQIMLKGWKAEDLFNFLKSSYVRKDWRAVSALELGSRSRGIFQDREAWLGRLDLELLKEIAGFEDRFRSARSRREFSAVTKALIRHFGLFHFPDLTDVKTRTDRQAAKRILLLLEELERKGRPGEAQENQLFEKSASEFLALMEVDLFSVHWRDKNRVQLYNVSLARQKEYKVVFLAGLLERQFPLQVREDPILSDIERRALNKRGEVLKERLPRQAFERYLFYLGATRASEYLILSYPRFDLEGKEALPSFYVDEVKRLFSGTLMEKKQPITEALPAWEDVGCRREAEQRTLRDLWTVGEGARSKDRNRVALSIYNELRADTPFSDLVSRAFESIAGAVRDGRIRPYFLPKQNVWSPTLLEEYAECPYRYFAHRLLKLESQAEGIDIRRRGTILHDVLEAFFTWRRDEKNGEVSLEEGEDFCLKVFEKLWEEEPLSGDRYYKVQLEKMNMRQMIFDLLNAELVEQKLPLAGLIPKYFEFEFKDLILEGKIKRLPLRGKIDRIDVTPDGRYALVIDYKTGKPFSMRAVENGTALQLPLYLVAVEEKLGLKPLGAHLYSLTQTASKGFHHQDHLELAGISTQKRNRLKTREFDALINRSITFAERFSSEIEAGRVPVRPRDCVVYCPYASLCRIEKWRLKHLYREIAEADLNTDAA